MNISNKNGWLCSIIVLLFSCAENDNTTPEKETVLSTSSITIDSSEVSLEAKALSTIFSSLTKGDTDYVAFYFDSVIRVYDMQSGKLQNSIPMPVIQNEDSAEAWLVNSICLIDIDDVFTITRNYIIRYKHSDTIMYPINQGKPETLLYNLQNDHPVYDSNTGNLSLEQYSIVHSQADVEFYTTPVLASYNFSTQTASTYPITYPKIYAENYFGFMNLVYISSNKTYTLLSFPVSPDMYLLNRQTKQVKIIGGKSSYHTKALQPLHKKHAGSREEKMKYWTTTPEYNETLIDKQNGYIYRFFKTGQSLQQPDGSFNTYMDKKLILMIFDQQHKLLKEIPLDNSLYNNFISFTGNGKLYMECSKPGSGKMAFKIFRIK